MRQQPFDIAGLRLGNRQITALLQRGGTTFVGIEVILAGRPTFHLTTFGDGDPLGQGFVSFELRHNEKLIFGGEDQTQFAALAGERLFYFRDVGQRGDAFVQDDAGGLDVLFFATTQVQFQSDFVIFR